MSSVDQAVTHMVSPRSHSTNTNTAVVASSNSYKMRGKEPSGSYTSRYSKDPQTPSPTIGSNYSKASTSLATKNDQRETPVDISSLSFERPAKSEKSFVMIPSQMHEISEIFKENNNELNESVSVQDFLHELHPLNTPLTSRYISNQEYQNIQTALQKAQSANYAARYRRLQNTNLKPAQLNQNYQSPIPIIPERSDSTTSLHPSINQLSTPRTPIPVLHTDTNTTNHRSSQLTHDSVNSKIQEGNQSREQSNNESYSNPSNTRFGNVTGQREATNRSHTPDTYHLHQNAGLLSTSQANNSFTEPLKQDRSVATVDSRKTSFFEIRSLESAREDLKQFRHKLNLISGLELGNKKLSEPLKREIISLLDEWQKHNFTISSIEIENLKRLESILIKNGIRRDNLQSDKQEKSFAEKASGNISHNLKIERIGNQFQTPPAKNEKGAWNKELKSDTSSSSTSITQPSELAKNDKSQSSKQSGGLSTILGNVGGTTLVKGCFSNISSNYAKTLNKTLNAVGAVKMKQSENIKASKPSSRDKTQKDEYGNDEAV